MENRLKCLDGKTQNQKQSLNGMNWNRLSKSIFVGSNVPATVGIYNVVAHFKGYFFKISMSKYEP